jgi:ABC-type multidrug transport system fused ATPase/permease subunit
MLYLVTNFVITSIAVSGMFACVGAADKIVHLMEVHSDINITGGKKLDDKTVTGNIQLNNVKFHYPSKPDVEVLKGISISVDSDTKRVVALVGSSGCGKSSIIALIERYYEPNEGEVLFNGVNIKELDPVWYH